jgi:hypothetical protein
MARPLARSPLASPLTPPVSRPGDPSLLRLPREVLVIVVESLASSPALVEGLVALARTCRLFSGLVSEVGWQVALARLQSIRATFASLDEGESEVGIGNVTVGTDAREAVLSWYADQDRQGHLPLCETCLQPAGIGSLLAEYSPDHSPVLQCPKCATTGALPEPVRAVPAVSSRVRVREARRPAKNEKSALGNGRRRRQARAQHLPTSSAPSKVPAPGAAVSGGPVEIARPNPKQQQQRKPKVPSARQKEKRRAWLEKRTLLQDIAAPKLRPRS